MCHLTRHFHAAYLTWGADQELTTLEGYGVLAARTANTPYPTSVFTAWSATTP